MRAARMSALMLAGVLSLVVLHDTRIVPLAIAAQAPTPALPAAAARHVDRARLMRDVETLAAPRFEGRGAGTPGGTQARQWIVDQFTMIRLAPAGSRGYLQPFPVITHNVRALWPGGQPFRREFEAANVIGRVAGRDVRARTIVVTAHYDHLGIEDGNIFPGADDNASGVVVLLAAARYFTQTPPRHPVVFAALDAEEVGQRGARALIASDLLPRGGVALNVNLDMVSRSDKNEIFAAGTSYSPWLRPLLEDVRARASVTIRFGHDAPASRGDGLEDWTESSDHGPFHEAGIPFIYFGVEDHADYHTPTDTSDRINPRFFGDAADMIVEALQTIDAGLESRGTIRPSPLTR